MAIGTMLTIGVTAIIFLVETTTTILSMKSQKDSVVKLQNVEQKLKDAPDGQYQIGILIGSFVPFIVLVGIAYILYYRAKKK